MPKRPISLVEQEVLTYCQKRDSTNPSGGWYWDRSIDEFVAILISPEAKFRLDSDPDWYELNKKEFAKRIRKILPKNEYSSQTIVEKHRDIVREMYAFFEAKLPKDIWEKYCGEADAR